MSNAELSVERVDGPYLHTVPSARVSQLRRGYVISPIRYDQREGRESIHDRLSGIRPGESLEKFLENQARGEDCPAGLKGLLEPADLRARGRDITTQSQ